MTIMTPEIPVGIDAISFYTSQYCIDLSSIAEERGMEATSFYESVGQKTMAVPPPGEDIVTMATNAARRLTVKIEKGSINNLLFATESGIDQSKAGGIYVHNLLELPARCRVFEIKQACYGATAALQMALPMLREQPDQKILIVATDIARYGLGTAGEPTQGGGAVAFLLSAYPKLIEFDRKSGFYTEDVMDFWRPNYRDEAIVDGKASVRIYIRALIETWQQYQQQTGREFSDFDRFCYHLPFTRMAETAHNRLCKISKTSLPITRAKDQIEDSLIYNRLIGNSYAASLYIGLTSLLDRSRENLAGKRIAFFSYGSGCMAEFFSGTVCSGYEQHLFKDEHWAMIRNRTVLDYPEYKKFYDFSLPTDGSDFSIPEYRTGSFRLSAYKNHKRIYERLAD